MNKLTATVTQENPLDILEVGGLESATFLARDLRHLIRSGRISIDQYISIGDKSNLLHSIPCTSRTVSVKLHATNDRTDSKGYTSSQRVGSWKRDSFCTIDKAESE